MRRFLGTLILVTAALAPSGCDKKEPKMKADQSGESKEQPGEPSSPSEASASSREPTATPHKIDPPSNADAMAPHLFETDNGIGLSWLQHYGAPRAKSQGNQFVYAVFDGDEWSEPTPIRTGSAVMANWADTPSVKQLRDGSFVAQWLVKDAGSEPSYGFRVAGSPNGKDWEKPTKIYGDETATEHGFVSFFEVGETLNAVWLDGREMASDSGGAMALRSAKLDGDPVGRVIDGRVCECCQTDAAVVGDGDFTAIVVYRNRTEDEERDIWMVRRDLRLGTGWRKPRRLSRDEWSIDGCPVNGPAIDADGQRAAVAWFTGANQRKRVRVKFSSDGGVTFGETIDVDAQQGKHAPLGRVDVELVDGAALVSWLDGDGDRAAFRVRRITPDGTLSRPYKIASTRRSQKAGFPKIARLEETLVAVWTEASDMPRLRARQIPVGAIPTGAQPNVDRGNSREGGSPGHLPELKLRTLDGQTVALRGGDGPTLVNLWATWCAPCTEEMPLLDELHEAYADTNLSILGISVDERANLPRVKKLVEAKQISYPIRLDPDGGVMRAFGAVSLPATFLFDPKGHLVWSHAGALDDTEEVERAVAPMFED